MKAYAAALSAAALWLAGCGGAQSDAESDGMTTVRWMYDFFPTPLDIPVLVAQEQGFFTDANLDVKVTPGGEANQTQSVGTGQHDITVAPGITILKVKEQDLPITAVGAVQQINPAGLACNPEVGIDPDDPSSLAGHTVGIRSDALDDHTVWQVFRDKHGLKGKVKEVEIGYDLAVLFEGKVDCYPDWLTMMPALVEQHYGKEPVTFSIGVDLKIVGQVMAVNNKFAAENPEAVASFVEAYAKGIQWTIANQDEALELLFDTYPELNQEAATAALPTYIQWWNRPQQNGLLTMTDSTWQPTVDVMTSTGLLDEEPNLDEIYTTQYLPDPPITP